MIMLDNRLNKKQQEAVENYRRENKNRCWRRVWENFCAGASLCVSCKRTWY